MICLICWGGLVRRSFRFGEQRFSTREHDSLLNVPGGRCISIHQKFIDILVIFFELIPLSF